MGGNGKFLRRNKSSVEGVEEVSRREWVNWRRWRIRVLSMRTEEQRSRTVLMVM